jgi:hypothetical protein
MSEKFLAQGDDFLLMGTEPARLAILKVIVYFNHLAIVPCVESLYKMLIRINSDITIKVFSFTVNIQIYLQPIIYK